MKRSKRNVKKPMSEINTVPYIDVMLVLLVIFMITAPMLTQGVNVNLPKAQAKTIQLQKQLPLIVSINQQGDYYLNLSKTPLTPMSPQDLLYRVAALRSLEKDSQNQRPIYIKADSHVPYGTVVKMMAVLEQAGADHVGLITQPHNS
mgnify:CR=1 FL=1